VATIDENAIEAFRASLRGQLLRPGDGGYDEARKVWNAMIDRYPALIARCAGVADIIAVVDFAREHGLLVSVRGGGHNVAGNAVCDGGLMIDLSPMRGICVDPRKGTVWAEAGVTWGELDHETQAFGLAAPGGVISTTGIAGLTLGGGFGWLLRTHGLACDNLVDACVVTADGRFLVASETENPDLFWGLHGGGGNFGVVTSFTFRAHPVGPELLAGPLFHPVAAAGDVLRAYREIAPGLPQALTCHAAFLTSPDGAPLLALIPAYIGPVAEGEAAVRPLREIGPPAMDLVGPTTFRALQTLFDGAYPHGRRNYWKSGFLAGLDDVAIETMIEHYARVPSPYSTVVIEQHGGAVDWSEPEASARPRITGPYNLIITAEWEDAADDAANIAWARGLWEAMSPYLAGGVYVNYLGEEGADRVREAYAPGAYNRLVALKRRYDPHNFFRLNQNVAP
jgi:FAD/FMN-containing dehydrogenase